MFGLGRLIDEQISIALETRESLVSQREILKVGVLTQPLIVHLDYEMEDHK